MNGNLVSNAGQSNIRSALITGESVLYRGASLVQSARTVSIPMMMAPMVMPMGMIMPMAISVGSTPAINTEMPPTSIPVVPTLVSPALPVLQVPITQQSLSANLLFKEARVGAEILKLSPPQIFRDVIIYAVTPVSTYFREVTITSSVSRIITPDIFSNITVSFQIR